MKTISRGCLSHAQNNHVLSMIRAMHCLTWTLFIRKHVLFVIRLSVFRPSVNTALVTCDIFNETYGNPNARAMVCFKRGMVTKRFEITGFQIKRSLFQSLNPPSLLVFGRHGSSPCANLVTRQLVPSSHHLVFYQVRAKLEIFVLFFYSTLNEHSTIQWVSTDTCCPTWPGCPKPH